MDLWGALIMLMGFLGLFGLLDFLFSLIANRSSVSDSKRFRMRFSLLQDEFSSRSDPLWSNKGAYAKNLQWDAALKKFPQLEKIYILISRSGKKTDVSRVLMIMAGCSLVGLILGLVLGLGIFSLLVALLGLYLPILALRHFVSARSKKIEEQLPDALDMLGQSMRAGHAFSSAFKLVGMQSPEPIATEFRRTSDEITFGSSVREGVLGLAQRVDLMDVRYFVLTVLIQLDTGGSLSALLQDLAKLIRERMKLRKTIKVLSAEGRLSAWVLGLLPVLFGSIMAVMSPHYLDYFWKDPTGIGLAKLMGLMLLIGVLWMKKMTEIKV